MANQAVLSFGLVVDLAGWWSGVVGAAELHGGPYLGLYTNAVTWAPTTPPPIVAPVDGTLFEPIALTNMGFPTWDPVAQVAGFALGTFICKPADPAIPFHARGWFVSLTPNPLVSALSGDVVFGAEFPTFPLESTDVAPITLNLNLKCLNG